MQTYKLTGVKSGTYEGNKWGKLSLLYKSKSGCGWFPMDPKQCKCDYFLAVQIEQEWELYENQEVVCSADLNGRINSCQLAG